MNKLIWFTNHGSDFTDHIPNRSDQLVHYYQFDYVVMCGISVPLVHPAVYNFFLHFCLHLEENMVQSMMKIYSGHGWYTLIMSRNIRSNAKLTSRIANECATPQPPSALPSPPPPPPPPPCPSGTLDQANTIKHAWRSGSKSWIW